MAIKGLTEENKKLFNELVEQGAFNTSDTLLERLHTTTDTDPDDATVNRPKWREKIFQKSMSRLIADQFYETISMSARVMPNPTFDYRLEEGVTTAEVEENGLIPGAVIEYGKQDLHAVKHALKAGFTQENIEDAFAAGIDARAKAINSISILIAKEIDTKLNRLMDASAVSVMYFNKEVPADWDGTDREYWNKINDKLVDLDTSIEGYDYKADAIMVHPNEKGLLRKTEDYTMARRGDYPEFKGVDGEAAGLPVFVSTNRDRGHIIMAERNTQGTYGIYKPFHTMPAVYDADYDRWLFNGRERSAMRVTVGEALALLLITQTFEDETLTVDSEDNTVYNFANWRINPSVDFVISDNGTAVDEAEYTVDYWEGTVNFDTAPAGPVTVDKYEAVKK